MKKLLFISLMSFSIMATNAQNNNRVTTANGVVEGTIEASGVRSFKGLPFGAPPVGELRWKEPQPVQNWEGVRKADKFENGAMQPPIFGDMDFRFKGKSEDCLYLNVWAPAKGNKLPVLVYFYGGGFVAGDGSEPRYDGESMATKGIIAVTVNYRLGVFGFFAHPELSKESPHQASGNYGLLDQYAALRWVQQNIAAFGGDPKKVTIAGESAGSVSVSAQMASPLSKDLIAGAIGESGSILGTLSAVPLKDGEASGVEFAKTVNANSLADLRAMPADKLGEAAGKFGPFRFGRTIDGYFFPKDPLEIFKAGEQAQVPLLVGWNSEEGNSRGILGNETPTKENFEKAVKKLYGDNAAAVLAVYNPADDADVEQVATDLASDRFIGLSTWLWSDLQAKTGKPVYRYLFSRPRPEMTAAMGDVSPGLAGGVVKNDANTKKAPPAKGAVHSAEIEYAMGNLPLNKVFDWKPEDYKVSKTMQAYFVNFIKTLNPNGAGLPKWPAVSADKVPVMHIDVNTRVELEAHRDRYIFFSQGGK
ncbi:MAG: carboxylesterase family protein [Ferruginibacter sp.]